MAKHPEISYNHPSFNLDAPPTPLREPTWLDRFFSPGDIARIRYETPLDREQGMELRRQRVKDELEKAHDRFKGTLTNDKEKLGRVIEVYVLLTEEEAVKNQAAGIMVVSEVAAGLHLIRTKFEIDFPPYEVFHEEE